MKSRFTVLGIIATVVMGVCALFISCKEELNDVVKYSGQVVYMKTTTPFPNLVVKVTNGTKIHCQGFTDDGGMFTVNVKVNEIDGNYYLLAGDSTCVPAKVLLSSYGQAEVDLGVIEVEGPSKPVVVTHNVSSVTADGAICGGEVTSTGRLKVTARGVCYGKNEYPDISGQHTKDGEGAGEFKSTLSNLEYNTIYYVRAYATNDIGTAYGEQIKFTTEEGVPVVVTDTITRVTAHSARCLGHVESDGGFPVTERGMCWSTYPDPTIDDNSIKSGSGKGDFTSDLTELERNTTYYVRTYATNCNATVYGEQKSFTTLDGLATVSTDQAIATTTTITVACEVTDDGGFAVTERGVCYSAMNAEPSELDNKIEYGRGKGSYKVSITDLNVATTFYVRAYAINENGTAYGKVLQVTTSDGMATVEINGPKDVTALTAACEVTVTDAGGATLQSCGICWSTRPNPKTSDSTSIGGNALNMKYTCEMINLTPATTYYVCGYATTDVATTYSAQITVVTSTGLPVLTTDSVKSLSLSFTAAGSVNSDGGYDITERGFCYSSTNAAPTITDNNVVAGSGVGSFSAVVTDLSPNTTYYVRAYATNRIGTDYGQTKAIVTSDGTPVVETIDPGENITSSSIVAVGNVIDAGGSTVTGRGIVYGTTPYPTLDNSSNVSAGQGIGYFSATISGISPTQNTYYIRAYATNSNGTGYGNQIVITPERSDYLSLRTMVYGGYTYKIKPIGPMAWQEGNNACENMTYGGYDDWFMPDKGEVEAILRAYGVWGINGYFTSLYIHGNDHIWTSTSNGSYQYYYYINNNGYNSSWRRTDTSCSDCVYEVIAVRRYRSSED